jgi:hypothetical protein
VTSTYPITERRSLGEVDPKGILRRRIRSDLPTLDAHQVLVYRVDGQYVLDGDRMRKSDDRVVTATHVSVVDVRRDNPVVVHFEIPSADAASFKVTVTFSCTVTDPVSVVRSGVECRVALWGYLQAHSRLFDLGQDYRLEEFNELRRAVAAQITAYFTIKPPAVDGVSVALGSVSVPAPAVWASFEDKNRGNVVEDRLARQGEQNQQQRELAKVRGKHAIDLVEQSHTHDLAEHEQAHTHVQGTRQADYEIAQYERRTLAMAADARQALMAAFSSGQIDASILAQRIEELDQHQFERARERTALERDEKREMWLAEREDRRAREAAEREEGHERFRARVELLKQAASNGHFDMVNLQADRLYAEVMGISPPPAVEDAARPRLASGESTLTEDEAGSRVDEDD